MNIHTRHLRFVLGAAAIALLWCPTAMSYQLAQKWITTASGAAGPLGTPLTLTWGFAVDGSTVAGIGNSELVTSMDSLFGPGEGGSDLKLRPWFDHFEYAFDRWSSLSGLTFQYEPNDDGVALQIFPGRLEVRADIRIAGAQMAGVLGFGDFPLDGGDVVLNTGAPNFLSDPYLNYRSLHNLMTHEVGHALAMRHVESLDSDFLMEAAIDVFFEGPQLDDIRGLHRVYGDVFEKINNGSGNGTPTNAMHLGALNGLSTLTLGADAGSDTIIDPHEVDFVSIDDNSDVDFFSFDVASPTILDATLSPRGATYLEGPQGSPGTLLDSLSISDLNLAIFDTDGQLRLADANAFGAGEVESITGLELPSAGRYYARVTGMDDGVQLYQLDLTGTTIPEPDVALLLTTAILNFFFFGRCRVYHVGR